jgi:hypothetical protein
MNLGKLLGAGKSFVSGNNTAAYHADKRAYLPKFVSPKNPFTPAEPSKPAAENSAAPAKRAAMSALPKTPPMPAISATPKSLTAWTTRLNPMTMLSGPQAEPETFQRPVQPELSLETIKVVHNDLTDADVEIVPMKSRPAREPVPEMQPAKKSWEILGERIMRATAL